MRRAVDRAWMRTNILLSLALVAAVGCTKPNPNRCCIDEADCAAADLPVGMTCDDGRVCRANVCITEVCDSNASCDVLSPYCIEPPDGVCQDTCTADSQCPGNGEATTDQYCEAGHCVQCRTEVDCSGATPVCDGGACVACTLNEQCASGVCTDAGTCAAASEVAYVDAAGSPNSDCTAASPCSAIERALAQLPARLYILISSGNYTRTGPLVVPDRRFLIGRGTAQPVIDRTDNGPTITVQGVTDLHLENVELSGATAAPGENGTPQDGYAIYCKVSTGAPSLTLDHVQVRGNSRGIAGRQCKITIYKSGFSLMDFNLETTDAVVKIDSSFFIGGRVNLDGGLYTVTNNFFVASNPGVDLYSDQSGNVVEFNTFLDAPFGCGGTVVSTIANNIFARSGDPRGFCTFPGSIIAPTDLTAIKLAKPDGPPWNFHLLPGSSAIDAAVGTSSLNHDIDGDARPKGAGRDVGADEAQ